MNRILSILILVSSLILSGCFNQHQFQTAKTLHKGEVSIGAGVLAGTSSSLLAVDDFDLNVPIGDAKAYARVGLGKRQDIGLSYALLTQNVDLDYKHMVVGDHDSKFVLSPGVNVGTSILGLNLFSLRFGLHMHSSYELNDQFRLFLTPTIQFDHAGIDFISFSNSTISRLGGTAGIEFDKKDWKFIIGLHFTGALDGPQDIVLSELRNFTIGYGASYTIRPKKENNKPYAL